MTSLTTQAPPSLQRRLLIVGLAGALVMGMMAPAVADENGALWEAEDEVAEDSLNVSAFDGELAIKADNENPDGKTFRQGQSVNALIEANEVSGVSHHDDGEDRELAVVFDGSGPEGIGNGEDVGQALFDEDSYNELLGAIGTENLLEDGENTLFDSDDDDPQLTFASDAEPGDWTLEFWIVELPDEYESGSDWEHVVADFTATITIEELDIDITFTGDESLNVDDPGSYDIKVENKSDSGTLEEWKLGLQVEGLEEQTHVDIEWWDPEAGQDGEFVSIDDLDDRIETSWDGDILWVLGADEQPLEVGQSIEDEFRATFTEGGNFTGTAYVIDTSDDG